MTNSVIPTEERLIVLSGGRKVSEDFYRTVQRQVVEYIPKLQFDREYKSQDLIDPLLWDASDKQLHILIGKCVAHLVANGKVALAFVGCPRCNNKRYVRI